MKTYRAAWKEAGHPGDGQVFLRVPVYVADTEEKAREEPRESIMHLLRYHRRSPDDVGRRRRRARHREPRRARPEACRTIDYEEVLRERMIVGTPGRVVDRLEELQEELGLDGILAELNPGSLIPHARCWRRCGCSVTRSCRSSSRRVERLLAGARGAKFGVVGDIAVGDDGQPSLHLHAVLGLSDGTTRGGHSSTASCGRPWR